VFSFTDVRQQLADQLKCLDVRLESHVTMLGELQDFYRRRSEVELEYSRGIDKLVKQIMARHKTDKQKSVSHISAVVAMAFFYGVHGYTTPTSEVADPRWPVLFFRLSRKASSKSVR